MTRSRKYLGFLFGVVVGVLLGFATGVFVPFGPPLWITFPYRTVSNNDFGGYAVMAGRIGDNPAYPNNYVQITCRKELQSCSMVKLEEIDRPNEHRGSLPQIGDIDPAESFKVTSWSKGSLLAVDESYCEVRHLNADFDLDEAEIVVEPRNLSDMNCKGTAPVVVRYPIEKPLDGFDPKYARR